MISIILLAIYLNASEITRDCSTQTEEIQKIVSQKTKPISQKFTSFWIAVVQKCTFRKKKKSNRKFEASMSQKAIFVEQNQPTNESKDFEDNQDKADTTESKFSYPKCERLVAEYRNVTIQLNDIFNSKSRDGNEAARTTESIYLNPKPGISADEDVYKCVEIHSCYISSSEAQDKIDPAKTADKICLDSNSVKSVDEEENKSANPQSIDNLNHGRQDNEDTAKMTESIYANFVPLQPADESENKSVFISTLYEQDEVKAIDSIEKCKTTEDISINLENSKLASPNKSKSTILQSSRAANSKSFDYPSKMKKKSRKKRRAPAPPILNKVKIINPLDPLKNS